MFNTLILAKKLFIFAVIITVIIGCLAINAQIAGAAYGVNSEIKQVKTADNPTVYYLDHARGVKKSYVSAKAFLAYGNKWSDIKVISQAELNKWPEVKLVKAGNDKAVYYIANGRKAVIESAQQFIDSGFKWPDIVTIAQADLAEYDTADFKAAGAIGDYSDNPLSVALDASSPGPDYLAIGTQDNLTAVFNLKADGRQVEITNLVLDLKGFFNQEVIKKFYLTDESDIEYPAYFRLHGRQAIFNFTNKPMVINSGETKKLKVYVDFNDNSAEVANQAFSVVISQAASITGAKALGAFPLAGETFKLISGVGVLESVAVSEQSLGINNNQAIIGSTEKNIGKFNLAETSSRSDVFVKELKFSNQSKVIVPSLNNFKLKNKAGQIISTVSEAAGDKEIVFKLNNYKIKKGGDETFTVSADVIGGDGKLINLYLKEAKVLSSQGNYSLYVSIANLEENITIKREAVGVTAKELKANNKVFTKQTGVIIGNFEIRNNNQKISLNRLTFSLEKNSASPNLTGVIYLVNYNSGEVYDNFDGDEFNNGKASVDLGELNLAAKQNLVVALVTKVPESVSNGGYYKIILNSLDYSIGSGASFSDTVNIAGAKLMISKSSLYLYPNNDLGDQAFIKGQKNIKIASFIVEGAAGGDTKITDLTFARGGASSGVISFDNGFSNLKFYIGSTKIKEIKNPYSNDLTAAGFKYILKSGARAEIKVYADTETDLKASEVQLAISNLAAVNNNSLIPAVVNNLNVNSHKTAFGPASAEITKVTEGFVTKGENDNVVAGFKVKNSGIEDLKLESITINSADRELTYSLGYSNLKVINRDKQKTAGSTITRPVAGANKISLGGFVVKAGEEAVFDVHVKTSELIADKNMDIYFSDFKARGKSSKVSALINGDPTDSYKFTIATGASEDNGQPNNGTAKTFIKPVSGAITYGWHDTNYPYKDSVGEHTGIDIAVSQGTSVKAAGAGTVIEVVDGSSDQASYIAISHGNGLITRYAHLSHLDVKVGDQVKQRGIIGLSGGKPGTPGAGPYTNGAHLHFEVLLNGASVDPEKYL
ncbi:MAG: M23 family metallopeptidase [Patescibacteria group bacterium]|jgi:murein DD-endopeptidase MepM/ murein hydrolase activator NlpD